MADIPMLAGFDYGSAALPQLAQNIARIVNPNLDMQLAFKNQIAKDPSILQQLANLPNASSVLQNLGFGNSIANTVGGIGQSIENKVKDASGQATLNALQNPETATIAGTVRATGKTPDEIKTGQVNAQVATATAPDVITQASQQTKLNAAKLQEADTQLNTQKEALTKFPSLAGVNLNQVAFKLVRGEPIDPILLNRIQIDPGAAQALDSYQKALLARMEMANRLSVEEIAKQDKSSQILMMGYLDKYHDNLVNQLDQARKITQQMTPSMLQTLQAQSSGGGPLAAEAKQKVDDYNKAKSALEPDSQLQKDIAEASTKYKALLVHAIGGFGENNTDAPPPDLKPALDALNGMNKNQRTAALSQLKKTDPAKYNRISPFLPK